MSDHYYKFRPLNARALAMIEKPELYFASPRQLNDPFEVGLLLNIPGNIEKIAEHLSEYAAIVHAEYLKEIELGKQHYEKYFLNGDIEAYYHCLRRLKRCEIFRHRWDDAQNLISQTKKENSLKAKLLLENFYHQIIGSLYDTAVCCLSRNPTDSPMWTHYADNHRGVCFEFTSDLFARDKKISKHDVFYTNDGRINPLEFGYLRTFNLLFSTKNISWRNEEETRFFIFGDPRPVRIRPSKLKSVILGVRTRTGEGLDAENLARHQKCMSDLENTIHKVNRGRKPIHKVRLVEVERGERLSPKIPEE